MTDVQIVCAKNSDNNNTQSDKILPASAQDIDVALEDRSHEDLETSSYQVQN